MKLVRFGPAGREKPGILDDQGRIRDLSKLAALENLEKLDLCRLPVTPEALKPLARLVTGVADRATHNRAGMEQTLERLAAVAESSSAPS